MRAVVVGAGVFGASCARELAARGHDVTLVEQYVPGHVRSASGGDTRLLRFSHGEFEWYTLLACRSLELWRELEAESGQRLFEQVGVAWFDSGEGDFSERSQATLQRLGIACERLSPEEARRLYPSLGGDDLRSVLLEPDAGVLHARRATRALAAGLRVEAGAPTPADPPRADAVVWACGSWLPRLFPALVSQQLSRRDVFFVGVDASWAGTPGFCDYDAAFYGHGELGGLGMKLAPDHDGGEVDPDRLERLPSPESAALVRDYLARRVPALAEAPIVASRVCQYDLTPDTHFLLARHPERPVWWLLGGSSGHGFKHGPALAELVADCVEGTREPEPFLGLGPREGGAQLRLGATPRALSPGPPAAGVAEQTSSPALSEQTRKRLTLVACILGSTIVFVDSTVVNVALPAIGRDLGGGFALQQWVVDAYLLTLGSLILLGGSLGDLFGSRAVLVIGLLAFGATSLVCALAWDGDALIVARALQGVAGALLTPAALATITAVFSGEERGAAIGSWTAWTGIAFVVGPLAGGWLVGAASWRAIFLINPPLVLVTVALVLVAVAPPAEHGQRARIDVVGATLCVLGLAGPVAALIEEPRYGFANVFILAGLVGGAGLLVAFVVWERRTDRPMLPLRLFARRNFAAANLETFTVYAGLSTLTFFLVLFLQQLGGYSPLRSGLATVPITVVMFALSGRSGRLAMRFGPRLFMGLGPLACAAALVWLARLGPGFSYWTALLPPLLLFSIGLSGIVAPLTSTVLADAGPGDAGVASGVNNAIARVAGLLGIAIVGAAVAGHANRLELGGFHTGMTITAALVGAGGLIGLAGIRNRPLDTAEPAAT